MITTSYDTSEPIITPQSFNRKGSCACDVCLITYSQKILDFAVSEFKAEKIANLDKSGTDNFLYHFSYGNHDIAIFKSTAGAVPAAMNLLSTSVIASTKRFISFGSAGSLDNTVTKGKYVIPTQAYRDEGLSYHYAPASDFIEIKNAKVIASVFEKAQVPFTEGYIWTTDAPFMETKNKVAQRKSEGCVAVDMEIAGLQAVCNHYNLEFYCFVETGDVVSPTLYSKSDLGKANHGLDKFFAALNLATSIIS